MWITFWFYVDIVDNSFEQRCNQLAFVYKSVMIYNSD